jgi:hypothetical protein
MDKAVQVLSWFVMGTLALAIARQLSEQKIYNMIPSNYGAAFNDRGLLAEGFANPDSERRQLGRLTAQSCFEKDFMAQSAKTGNFIQRTNNFRHEEPDNCSAPLTEFVRA